VDADSPWEVAQEIIRAARGGNPLAISALQDSFFYLGIGIVTLINILNLRLVILGGGIVNGFPEGVEIVRTVIRERGRVGIREKVEVDRPYFTDLPHLVGANVLIEQHLQRTS
jgi:predicted NBD/HSP70 family sugar kinase